MGIPVTTTCPADEVLGRYADGDLRRDEAAQLERHIDQCSLCREVVVALAVDPTESSVDTKKDVPQTLWTKAAKLDLGGLPDRVGRFRVLQILGKGGMGVVYRAHDETLRRDVAVKVILDHAPSLSSTLLYEARSMARLSHENVLPVYEVGQWEGRVFLAMELVEGQSLRRHMRQRPGWRQALAWLIAAGRGLEAAHKARLVHRDFKPDNVLIGNDGRVRVTDFGLAEPVGSEDDDEDAGSTLRRNAEMFAAGGTPAYMSPEQYEGEPGTHLSDLFSFCVALFEGLFGARPFRGKNALEMRASIVSGEVTQVSLGAVPAELYAVVCQGLSRLPADRPASMTALLQELERFADKTGSRSEPFPGLIAFGTDDAGLFFGRDREVSTAIERMQRSPLIGVVGPSGAGKSSFVRAGVFSALRKSGPWRLISLRPGRTPLANLDLCVRGANDSSSGAVDPAKALARNFAKDGVRQLLAIDQMEELFTLCSDVGVRREFLRRLLAAAADPSWGAVMVTLRSDFIDSLAPHRRFLERLTENLMYLAPMGESNLRAALVEPLAAFGFQFEDTELVGELAAQLAATSGSLSLLQFAGQELWARRDNESATIPRSAYVEMGEIAGALSRHGDAVVNGLVAEDQELFKRILVRMVTPQRTRDVVSRAELVETFGGRTEKLLQIATESRLVVQSSDADESSFELIHESLISSWPRLASWVEESREDSAYLAQIRQAASQWHKRGRAPGLLWRGAAASELMHWRRRSDAVLAPEQYAFVGETLSLLRRTRTRRRAFIVGGMAALALAVVASTSGYLLIRSAEREARDEAERAQAAESDVREKIRRLREANEKRERAERQRKSAELKRLAAEEKRQLAEAQATEAQGEVEQSREQLKAALERSRASERRALASARREKELARSEAKARAKAEALAKRRERELARERARRRRIAPDSLK